MEDLKKGKHYHSGESPIQTFRIAPEDLEWLKEHCAATGLNKANIYRAAFEKYRQSVLRQSRSNRSKLG